MKSKQEVNYLDIGVKFRCLNDKSSINIYFPLKITKDNYVDSLGRTLTQKPELVAAIFNTHVKSWTIVAPNIVDIAFVDNEKSKSISPLRIFSQIELSEKDGDKGVIVRDQDEGSILTFPKNLITHSEKDTDKEDKDNTNCFGYFRFRIKLNPEDKKSISQVYVSKDAKLLSRMESIEIVDFRVNEIRNLPQKIVSNLNNNSCITSVHFFLIRETNSEHKLSHTEFKRCRLLEKDLWDSYLNVPKGTTIPEHMLIYHWKEPLQKSDSINYLENFSAFAKFSTITVTSWTVIGFLFFILLWGALSGVLGNFLYSLFPDKSGKLPQECFLPIEIKQLLIDNSSKLEQLQKGNNNDCFKPKN